MNAFAKTRRGDLLKAYQDGDDWKVTAGATVQFYFSRWSTDLRGSLQNAMDKTARRLGTSIDSIQVVSV